MYMHKIPPPIPKPMFATRVTDTSISSCAFLKPSRSANVVRVKVNKQ